MDLNHQTLLGDYAARPMPEQFKTFSSHYLQVNLSLRTFLASIYIAIKTTVGDNFTTFINPLNDTKNYQCT